MNMKGLIGSLLMAFALFGAVHASAQDAIVVTATVPVSCTFTANPLAFGNNVTGEADLDVTGTVVVRCPDGTAYALAADGGGSGDASAREMDHTNDTDTLSYNLYINEQRTTIWDDTNRVEGSIGSSGIETPTYHARIPATTTPEPGDYTDMVMVTVTVTN